MLYKVKNKATNEIVYLSENYQAVADKEAELEAIEQNKDYYEIESVAGEYMFYKIRNTQTDIMEYLFKTQFEAMNKLDVLMNLGRDVTNLVIEEETSAYDPEQPNIIISDKFFVPYFYPELNTILIFTHPEIKEVKFVPAVGKVRVLSIVDLTDTVNEMTFAILKDDQELDGQEGVEVFSFLIEQVNHRVKMITG